MTNTRHARFAALMAAGFAIPILCAQGGPQPLPAEAQKRLDHHVGEWDVRTEILGREGQTLRTTMARDTAEYIIPGRVVELTTVSNEQTVSKAWMFYNAAVEKFYLTSVDARGDLWILTGDLDEYVLTSEPKPHPRGGTVMLRFRHSEIEPDSFKALMEMSRDGGKKWWIRSRQTLTRRR